ncbi:MAG: pantoate--beta-alanine ligase [Bacillota bacterium]
MIMAETIAQVRQSVLEWKKAGKSVGFVPTMGCLHDGHMSLIRKAREENDYAVVSIFVNPTQFGPGEDFQKYPRDLERDSEMCRAVGVDLLFAPPAGEMYPEPGLTHVDVDKISSGLCGDFRPGHFRGVATVVCKLFNIVRADRAYFGEKDAQQLRVIRRMVRDLNIPVEIIGLPTVREKDGLAMSSRNTYLSGAERQAALVLVNSLRRAEELIRNGERAADKIAGAIREIIQREPLAALDYVAVVESETLAPLEELAGEVLVALAVRIGKTRLIDNMAFKI